jgi:hypothetical protein
VSGTLNISEYVRVDGLGIYKGCWKDKKFNGFGSLYYLNGSYFCGFFLNDRV